MTDYAVTQLYWVQKLIDGMIREGLEYAVISPGSRSTPLALVCERHPAIQTWLQVDERSAAFFALGLAKASCRPVVLIATSGSAPAHWYPAIIEANLSCIPLILLSADRPLELHHCGANQTIDQSHLFGNQVRHFYQLPPAQNSDDHRSYVYQLGKRVMRESLGPLPGPVHLNIPFQKPLVPTQSGLPEKPMDYSSQPFVYPQTKLDRVQLLQLVEVVSSGHGVIICGPESFDVNFFNPVTALAKHLALPVFADPLSGLRFGQHDLSCVLTHYDAFLRQHEFRPDWVLRFGAYPVSRYLSENLLSSSETKHYLVDKYARWSDPLHLLEDVITADPAEFCTQLMKLVVPVEQSGWQNNFLEKEQIAIDNLAASPCTESTIIHQCIEQIPDNSLIFCSNSMPIRDLDSFSGKQNKIIQLVANRGVSGIDGNLSTLLGLAAARNETHGPVIGLTGDLAFFHDMNGLLMAKQQNAIIVLFNNNGGMIFQHLAQAKLAEFEKTWRTPTNLDFSRTAELYGLPFQRVTRADDFSAAFSTALQQKGTGIIEILIDPEVSLREHQSYWQLFAS